MEKITEKWLREHGFEETTSEINDTYSYGRNLGVHRSYMKVKNDAKKMRPFIRIDHRTQKAYLHNGKVERSNWYSFYASGNGFSIENRISYKRFDVETIEAVMKIIGI